MGARESRSLGVLTSGGDAPGMNAAVRAVVRTALDRGVEVYAIREGFQGMVDGGDEIRPLAWDDVGGILHRGGTIIGTARCDRFLEREGRRDAARHLVWRGIDTLVVIGGDGSLTGADTLRREWTDLLDELVTSGEIEREAATNHAQLTIVGLVGSIDNDMEGTDLTLGATSALHRITEAIDALLSTAASHRRTFVVEVMGRHCGWLAVMAALATGADWVLIPESPPAVDDWADAMCRSLKAGREAGRRASIVILAEGAVDGAGAEITTAQVRRAIEESLGVEVRETILGHVQRGGSPSAIDRGLAALQGHAAVDEALDPARTGEARMIGVRENRVVRASLADGVEATRRAAEALAARDFGRAMALRGSFFCEGFDLSRTLLRAVPRPSLEGHEPLRLAVMTAGAPAPGMNAAVRVAVRKGLDGGHVVLGVRGGVVGLIEGRLEPFDWMRVNGWAGEGGSELGTDTVIPGADGLESIGRAFREHGVQGLLVIGGYEGYETARAIRRMVTYDANLDVPVICLPASIANDVPGSERSVGADSALNSVMHATDSILRTTVASRRAFVVEVAGGTCGWLPLMSGVVTGAERVYLHEEGFTLEDLQADVRHLVEGFQRGKRVSVAILGDRASSTYDIDFVRKLFEEAGGDLFSVRRAVLGPLQRGGPPSPFDRILAARLAARCVEWLATQKGRGAGAYVGVEGGEVRVHDMSSLGPAWDHELRRSADPWWMALRPVQRLLAQPAPRDSTRPRSAR